MLAPRESNEGLKIVEDATCTFCGCLCDDIRLEIAGNRIAHATNACALGETWFCADEGEPDSICLIDGEAGAVEDGIDRTAQILANAKYPLVHGLGHTITRAQRVAVSIADSIGACIDTSRSGARGASTLALQEVGEVTCTLGEVKNRGDLIIFWGCDPVESHPRHLSRYSLEPAGTFVPRGRSDRFCVVVDVRETSTAKLADQFLSIKPGKDFEALWALRALAKDVELDPARIEAETGVSLSTWQDLIESDETSQVRRDFLRRRARPILVDAHQICHAHFRSGPRYERACSVCLRAAGRAVAMSPAPKMS